MRERTRARRALAVTATVLAGVLGVTACAPQGEADDPTVANAGYNAADGSFTIWAPDERADAPEITGTTYGGEEIDLADWAGDVVVLNFWYAACPPCRAEAPDLAEVATQYADRGVHLLGVNSTDDAATADAFAQTFGVPYPSLDDSSASVVAALEGTVPLKAMPTTLVLDREGRPAARVLGLVDGATLGGLIDDVLAEG